MRYCYGMILAVIGFCSYGQQLDAVYRSSLEAREDRDYSKFVALSQEALKLHPSHPAVLYNLAAGYSLTGRIESTYLTLMRLLSWNHGINFHEDADFTHLTTTGGYAKSLDSLTRYYGETRQLSTTFATFQAKRHLEDLVVWDSLLFVTDVYHGELIRYNTNTDQAVVVKAFELPVMALAAGYDTNSLWISTAQISQSKKQRTPSKMPEILELDPLSGAVKSRITLADGFVAGSMVPSSDGYLYVSNSSRPEIIKVNTNTKDIVKTLEISEAFNLQGITLDTSNKVLYVADYIKGIARIDMTKGHQVCWLDSPDFLLKGIDGLNYIGRNRLLAIQNNSTPKRVVKIQLRGADVASVTLLDNNLATQGEPTNGKYHDTLGYLYVSNSPWPHYDTHSEPILHQWEKQKILQIPVDKVGN